MNYNFGYNPDYSLDSARVGNETRYINHGSDEEGLSNAIADSAPLSAPIYIVTDLHSSEARLWGAAHRTLG